MRLGCCCCLDAVGWVLCGIMLVYDCLGWSGFSCLCGWYAGFGVFGVWFICCIGYFWLVFACCGLCGFVIVRCYDFVWIWLLLAMLNSVDCYVSLLLLCCFVLFIECDFWVLMDCGGWFLWIGWAGCLACGCGLICGLFCIGLYTWGCCVLVALL